MVPAATTADRPLPGGVDVDGADGIAAIATRLGKSLPEDVATHLARTYGARCASLEARIAKEPELAERLDAELPFIAAEVDEAVEVEQAVALSDLLERRVPLSLYGRQQGLEQAERVARRIAGRVGWNDADIAREVDAYRAVIDSSRRFRA
jgi:glycerol-3-phosphate dehydrogenase